MKISEAFEGPNSDLARTFRKATSNPGTQEAIDAGCRCPVIDNSYGKGYLMQEGIFVFSGDCPIHGQEFIGKEKI